MSSTRSSCSFSESSGKGEAFKDIGIEPSCDSLLSLLDDKNRAIATLKKQLQNQKVQLTYYLKRELTSPKIRQLSKSCCPQALEESMTVNIAMNKFNKQMGIKSNIINLYERMSFIDEKIDNSLQDQEFILRKIVNKLCDFLKHAYGKIEFKVQFSNFISDPFHIDLFTELLSATLTLRKKLDTFRICCNRLMVVEDERNSIVEQIYSLPTEQRMNCNYLISTQMEKVQLENEIQLILKEQGKDKERIKDLNIIEEKLSILQEQLHSSFMRNDETCRINKMLQKVNSEAKILLELTKEQRRRYEKEMLRVRRQKNFSLERTLHFIRMALDNKAFSKKEFIANCIGSKEDLNIFECIKKEIDAGKDKCAGKLFDELQVKTHECDSLKARLDQVLLERNGLKIVGAQLQRDISNIRFSQHSDFSSLKEERDAYKSQVEDLEAIREAYAQLVDRQPTTSSIEKEYGEQIKERDKRIEELGRINVNLTEELNNMRNIINKQTKELTVQNEIITDLKEQHSENVKENETNKKVKYVFQKASNVDSGINSSPGETIFSDDTINSNEFNDEVRYDEVYEQEIFVEEEIVNWVNEEEYSLPLVFHQKQANNNATSDYEKQTTKVLENMRNQKTQKVSVSENETHYRCFKIVSKKQGKVSDVMEAVIKTSAEADLQSNIKMENATSFCLEINYKPKASSTSNEVEEESSEIDEYELMKDCSQETIPSVCQPRKGLKDEDCSRESISQYYSLDNGYAEKMDMARLEVLRELDSSVNDATEEYVKQIYTYKAPSI